MLRAWCRAFRAGLRRRALGAAFATWQEARGAAARVREHRVARACIALWRSHVQGGRADRQLRRARAQQAFMAWRVALGQRCEAGQRAEDRARARTQLALCWALWVQESRLHRRGRAHAARKLSARWMPRALPAGPGVGLGQGRGCLVAGARAWEAGAARERRSWSLQLVLGQSPALHSPAV